MPKWSSLLPVALTCAALNSSAHLGAPKGEGVRMTADEQKTVEMFVKSYLSPGHAHGPWLAHHIKMNWELFQKAKMTNPELLVDNYLRDSQAPPKASRGRRRGR